MIANSVLYLTITLTSIVILISLVYIITYTYSNIKLKMNIDELSEKAKEFINITTKENKEDDKNE